MGHVFERTQVDTFIMTILSRRHITMILDDLANVLGWHVLLLRIHKAELSLFGIAEKQSILGNFRCQENDENNGSLTLNENHKNTL